MSSQLLSDVLCCLRQILQTGFGLLFTASLQTAIGINPDFFFFDFAQNAMQGLFDFFNRRDARRMNVVNARTDFGLEILFFEFVKNFEI